MLGYDINSNQNNIAFGIRKAADKFIFEAGSTEKLENVYNLEVDDLFAEIAGSIISLNSNMPYTWINEHSATDTQIGALAHAAREIYKNT